MSEPFENPPPPDTRFPDKYSDATGKGDLHIPGAGNIGIIILLVSLSILFAASMVAFLAIRFQFQSTHNGKWPPPPFPPLPSTLWISTVVILAASFTIHKAVVAAKGDNEKGLVRWLQITMGVGILFLALQATNWWEFFRSLHGMPVEGIYLGMFYVLTGLHAAHVIGGLIPLFILLPRARKGRYSRNFHPGIRYAAAYWHFLDIVWCVLFCLIYF